MDLTKQHLINTFAAARERNANFVFVAVVAEGIKEVIAIPKESMDSKEQFYMKVYDDNLVHCMNSKVSIHGLSYGYATELNNL